LLQRIQSELETGDASRFSSFSRDLELLVASGFPARAVRRDLEETLASPTRLGPWRPNELQIYSGEQVDLSIWNPSKNRQFIHSLPSHAILVPCGRSSVAYTMYRFPAGHDQDVFDNSLFLQIHAQGVCEVGSALILPAGEAVCDLHLTEPTPMLKLLFGPVQTTEWLFQRDTLQAWLQQDADTATSQLRAAAHILGLLADAESLDALLKLSQHRSHAVRWAAMQNLSHVSKSKALERYREAATDDPHPHIRRGAQKVLDLIKSRTRA
jgi:hypothetical protein